MTSPGRIRIGIALVIGCSLGAFAFYRVLGWAAFFLNLGLLRLAHTGEELRLVKMARATLVFSIPAFLWGTLAFFSLQPYWIPSSSMTPSLQVGDRILVDTQYYRFHRLRVGDIVAYRPPDSIYDPQKPVFVKRVVGLPGDKIALTDGHLHLNGVPILQEPIASTVYTDGMGYTPDDLRFHEALVPPDSVYVLGDNSPVSYDSRHWGGVPVENLRGKVVYRFWPPSRLGSVR